MKKYLEKYNLLSGKIEEFIGARDNPELKWYKNNGFIFLENKQKKDLVSHNQDKSKTFMDDSKRSVEHFETLKNKTVLDIGSGNGGFGTIIKGIAKKVDNLEKNDTFPTEKYDVITMFHVLEHISEPIEFLKKIKNILNDTLIIEVPNSENILFKSNDFVKDTIWSDHLIVYNMWLLERILELAGFNNFDFYYKQRYSLDNIISYFYFGKGTGTFNCDISLQNKLGKHADTLICKVSV